MRPALIALAIGWLATAPVHAEAQALVDHERVHQAQRALSAQRVDQAAKLLEPWASSTEGPAAALAQVSMLRFYQGRYAEAVELMDKALSRANARGLVTPGARKTAARWRELKDLQQSTFEATRRLERAEAGDGRYVVHYPAGDSVLVPYALDVLAAMDARLSAFFDVELPGPLRLEIYPSPKALAQVSSLTVENIQTSGTVALAKWNRLMITSPRALVRGYPWMDTIAHELVHLALSYVSKDRAPVWLQEGLAKRLEHSWREDVQALVLHPASQALLARALRDGKLLPFERLHPSIALLPSQEDAALAFAQVATFVESYLQHHGRKALLAALAHIADGQDAKRALAKSAAQPWLALERRWREGLPRQTEKVVQHLDRRFKSDPHVVDETQEVEAERAKRFLRLGDLLWDRQRTRAAAIEYAKAHESAPEDPIVAARYARAALESGDAAAAERVVRDMVKWHPEHAPSQALLGEARLAQGKHAAAREPLREALRLNPFDPAPHCGLARASEQLEERARERKACTELAR